ncbi:hypothetical protein U0070_016906 [Myodes glareolus]|uniref:Uncharacterized protein n=1 Tax=Myodes glareolus TaxID=447135 RepID=A0AAW0IBF7_MYOGA
MGGGDGAAFKRPGDGARLQRVLGLGSRRAPRSLPSGGPAPPPVGHASAGPAAMSSHIAKSESKTSLLKAAAASGGSRAPRHGSARDPALRGRRLTGPCPSSPPPCGDPSSRRPLCRPVQRDEGARGSRRGLPQAHCRPRETLPPVRGSDGEERGLAPALGLRGSLRSRGRGDPAPTGAPEADPFLHRLHPMLSSAFGQVRAAPLARARGTGARDPTAAACPRPCSLCPVGAHHDSFYPPEALVLLLVLRCLIQHPMRCPHSGPLPGHRSAEPASHLQERPPAILPEISPGRERCLEQAMPTRSSGLW